VFRIHLRYKINDMNTQKSLSFLPEDERFVNTLNERVNKIVTAEVLRKARLLLWFKLFFYSTFFVSAYLSLFLFSHSFLTLTANYILVGLLGILLAFNSAHDAVHQTYCSKKWVNNVIYYLTFNLQGVNAYLWKIRHKASHHLFPNVDGCDSDIDDNPFLKLSPSQKNKWWFKYQAWYATALYFMYTLQWIFMKDFIYLLKKDLANLKNQQHSWYRIVSLLVWKAFYFFYMIVLPVFVLNCSIIQIISAFLTMHVFISVFFVLTLIISHLCTETQFPKPNEEGVLPFNYHQHQLAVSLDYHPESKLANWIFGGFNSHSAHHLYETFPHTLYTLITPAIKKTALEFNYPYHELTIVKAIQSHYAYLNKMGRSIN